MAAHDTAASTSISRPSWERARRECDRLQQMLPHPPIVELVNRGHPRLHAELRGPDGSPFAAAHFGLDLEIGEEYPFRPPSVRFSSPRRIFHPNICPKSGGICLDILNDANLWSPALGLEKLIMSIGSLLSEPRTEHGLNAEALSLLKSNPEAYAARAAAAASGSQAKSVPADEVSVDQPVGMAQLVTPDAAGEPAKPAAAAVHAVQNHDTEKDLSWLLWAFAAAVLAAIVVMQQRLGSEVK
eukprot:gnl/TRDRNA2_/TRDRNA2_92189_c0_seq1.p1 gnl/TRDRNA2_/TRDRNA2_92189_c0~~gnl/TRDRNA2_/TRDRNA2_92189_c0_seq1.p1  ORF type:complete len:242 (+),score=43.89 gnl/TRDRNA2_/TRDRNA2_92189_c0_seq1:105-830(+)